MARQTRVVCILLGSSAALPGEPALRTAYRKQRAAAARVLRERLDGDEQEHVAVHGGADRAVLAYCAAHYTQWRAESFDLAYGAFGENLVLDGLDERSTCIGDVYRVGTAVLEVSVPRTPCETISRATGVSGLYERVLATGRTGWLHRVLEEGELTEGAGLVRLARPHPDWTVERAADVMARMRAIEPAIAPDARALAGLPALATRWREKLRERADEAFRQ